MADVGSNVLQTLLDRLLAGVLNGPGVNCRPHASRQRIDLPAVGKLKDVEPSEVLAALLSGSRKVKIAGKVAAPAKMAPPEGWRKSGAEPPEKSEIDPAQREWMDQQAVFSKVRNIVEDGKTYEQDTGVH